MKKTYYVRVVNSDVLTYEIEAASIKQAKKYYEDFFFNNDKTHVTLTDTEGYGLQVEDVTDEDENDVTEQWDDVHNPIVK